jgi:hypothetical protein
MMHAAQRAAAGLFKPDSAEVVSDAPAVAKS